MGHPARGPMLAGGLGLLLHDAKCGINLYFPRATQWTTNTFHVILQSILFFRLVQYDGIHFIFINHDDFKFIWIFELQHSWKSETCQISWEKLLWSDGLSHFQNDADYRDFYIRAPRATGAQRPSPAGSECRGIALDRRFLGTIIAVFKMWLCPFNQPCIRHPMTN